MKPVGPLESREYTTYSGQLWCSPYPQFVTQSLVRLFLGFPGNLVIKNIPASGGDKGSIPGSARSPGEGNGNPLQYSCLGNPMEEELAGYSSWGHEESDKT